MSICNFTKEIVYIFNPKLYSFISNKIPLFAQINLFLNINI